MAKAWFRFQHTIAVDTTITGAAAGFLALRNEPPIEGRLIPPSRSEGAWTAEALSHQNLDDSVFVALQDIAARRLPEGSDESRDPAENVERWRKRDANALALPVLRPDLRSYFQDQQSTFRSEADRVFELARWVTNAPGPHRPFSKSTFEFSLNGKIWHMVPRNPPGAPMDLRVNPGLHLSTINWPVLSEMAMAGQSEPVGHSLIREALSLRASTPRAAVVIGAAAAETAVKEAIYTLAPSAAYLVDEVQSPPVTRLVKDYLPTLSSPSIRAKTLFPPPKPIRRSLASVIEARNGVVHKRLQQQSFPDLLSDLLHIRDLIWMLDCFCGRDWALNYVSDEIRSEIAAQSAAG